MRAFIKGIFPSKVDGALWGIQMGPRRALFGGVPASADTFYVFGRRGVTRWRPLPLGIWLGTKV